MLQNAWFSIKIVLPIFLLLGLGYGLRGLKILDEVFARRATKLLFYVIMPLKFIKSLWEIDRRVTLSLPMNLIIILGSTTMVALTYLLARLLRMERAKLGTFVQASFRGNYVYIGYILLERILGKVDPRAPLVLIPTMIVYNILSVLLLTPPDDSRTRAARLLHVGKKIVTNPLLIGVVIGLIFHAIRLPRVELIDTTLGYLGSMAMPLALLAIGASFRFSEVKTETRTAVLASFIKLVVNPAAVLAVAWALGFPASDLILLYVIFGAPTTVSTYAMVCEMDGDPSLGAGIILYSTALSALSMMLFLTFFKAVGWV